VGGIDKSGLFGLTEKSWLQVTTRAELGDGLGSSETMRLASSPGSIKDSGLISRLTKSPSCCKWRFAGLGGDTCSKILPMIEFMMTFPS
jgi:hypothetical protein